MFNKSSFNRTPFNRTSDDQSGGIFATLTSAFELEVALMKSRVALNEVTIAAEMRMQTVSPGLLVPLGGVVIGAEYGVSGRMYARMPLPATTVTVVFDLSAAAVRTAENEEMVLEGLNLAPGQTLIIDTDTLEIEVDNEVRVDCWVTGGTFFQFKAGENSLTFTDNAARRNLLVTVLWADRYL